MATVHVYAAHCPNISTVGFGVAGGEVGGSRAPEAPADGRGDAEVGGRLEYLAEHGARSP